MDTCGVLSQHICICLYTSQKSFGTEYSTPKLVAGVEREVQKKYLSQLRLWCNNDQREVSKKKKAAGLNAQQRVVCITSQIASFFQFFF